MGAPFSRPTREEISQGGWGAVGTFVEGRRTKPEVRNIPRVRRAFATFAKTLCATTPNSIRTAIWGSDVRVEGLRLAVYGLGVGGLGFRV